jgi:hypothetical protein
MSQGVGFSRRPGAAISFDVRFGSVAASQKSITWAAAFGQKRASFVRSDTDDHNRASALQITLSASNTLALGQKSLSPCSSLPSHRSHSSLLVHARHRWRISFMLASITHFKMLSGSPLRAMAGSSPTLSNMLIMRRSAAAAMYLCFVMKRAIVAPTTNMTAVI